MLDEGLLERLYTLLAADKQSALIELLEDWSVPMLLELWPQLQETQQFNLFNLLSAQLRSLLLASLAVDEQEDLIRSLSIRATSDVMAMMDPDDLVDLIQGVSAPLRQSVLDSLPESTKAECDFLLRFDENDAAGLMTLRYAALRPFINVGQALVFLRNQNLLEKLEVITYLYVLDPLKRLCGVVTIKRLLAAQDQQLVSEVMNTHCVTVKADDEHHEVAAQLIKHDLIAIPVVDGQLRMLGIVTFDDVFDVIARNDKRQLYMMSGINAATRGFFASPAWVLVLRRLPWLLVLLLLGTLSTNLLAQRQDLMIQFAFLALFIPIITQTGGNVGGQSATLLIRDLAAVERVSIALLLQILWKELLVAILLALAVGGVMLLRLLLLPPAVPWLQMDTVILALMVVVVASSLSGVLIPLLLRALHIDPAVAAGPVLSTLVDLLGLSFYFTVARWLLLS